MSPLLGHRPSLWMTHKGYNPPRGPSAGWVLTTANVADKRLNVPSDARSIFKIKTIANDIILFQKNDTLSERFTINTGQVNMDKMNMIEKLEGESNLNVWSGADCNR
jgi:hypothetical protein